MDFSATFGPLWVRIIIAIVLILAVVYLLGGFVFPTSQSTAPST